MNCVLLKSQSTIGRVSVWNVVFVAVWNVVFVAVWNVVFVLHSDMNSVYRVHNHQLDFSEIETYIVLIWVLLSAHVEKLCFLPNARYLGPSLCDKSVFI